jgi:hypothetical protein
MCKKNGPTCDCYDGESCAALKEQPKPISMTKKYKTRDGRDVRILCVDRKHSDAHQLYPVCGLINDLDGEIQSSWTITGKSNYNNKTDLVEVKEKVKVHLVMYYQKSDPRFAGGNTWSTEEVARNRVADRNRHNPSYHYWYECVEKEVE